MTETVATTECVLDAQDKKIIIWHVDAGPPSLGDSRMTGAWVIDISEQEKIALLVGGRRVLATDTGERAAKELDVPKSVFIDPDASVANFETERDRLQAAYDAHPRKASLVEPDWPAIPRAANTQDPPLADAPEGRRRALGLARWLNQVADVWDRIERERIARTYMPGESSRRPTPLAVRSAN